MRFFVLTVISFLLSVATPAAASVSVWEDARTGLVFSFPDTWQTVTNADPDTIVTIMAPSGRAHASCRVRVRADERFTIYPPHLDWAVQRVAYSTDFWNQYLGEYEDVQLFRVTDGAGLGRGFATYALAKYSSAVPGPYMRRKGMLFASLYNGNLYILECSSHEDAFSTWQPLFLSIAKSVDFKQTHTIYPYGYYRNFLDSPPPVMLKGRDGVRRILY